MPASDFMSVSLLSCTTLKTHRVILNVKLWHYEQKLNYTSWYKTSSDKY